MGVDFYLIGERGEQFGPFGARYSVQVYNQTGRGYFRCSPEKGSPAEISAEFFNGNGTSSSGGRKLKRRGGRMLNFHRLEKRKPKQKRP